jgi:hypothetical protein
LSSVTKTILNALGAETSRRRFAVQLGLGSVALLLSACGGGGGNGISDETNSRERSLRAAFDDLEKGMTPEDVINVVGRQPDRQTSSSYEWETREGTLSARFDGGFRPGVTITGATWSSSKEALTKSLV